MQDSKELGFKAVSKALKKPYNYTPIKQDTWDRDGPFSTPGEAISYDSTFVDLLQKDGVDTFQGLLKKRKTENKPAQVLDLFGSGYFLHDLDAVDDITAVRLKDTDEVYRKVTSLGRDTGTTEFSRNIATRALERLDRLKAWGKRKTIEGNLYHRKTWADLVTDMQSRGIPSFDLIVCRPEGAFDTNKIMELEDNLDNNYRPYAYIYLQLLDRAYSLCSVGGQIFTEIPEIPLPINLLEKFKAVMEQEGKVAISLSRSEASHRKRIMKLTKTPESPVSILPIINKYLNDIIPTNPTEFTT